MTLELAARSAHSLAARPASKGGGAVAPQKRLYFYGISPSSWGARPRIYAASRAGSSGDGGSGATIGNTIGTIWLAERTTPSRGSRPRAPKPWSRSANSSTAPTMRIGFPAIVVQTA